MTHDYKRNGTTTLFAALEVATGQVISECLPKHRHSEYLKFLKTMLSQARRDARAAKLGLWRSPTADDRSGPDREFGPRP